jgi:hypothetical protein
MLSRVHGRSDVILIDCQLRDPSSFLRRYRYGILPMQRQDLFYEGPSDSLFAKKIRESLIIIICYPAVGSFEASSEEKEGRANRNDAANGDKQRNRTEGPKSSAAHGQHTHTCTNPIDPNSMMRHP